MKVDEPPDGVKDVPTSTHFAFHHPVFRVADARFVTASDGEPSFAIKLGDHDALVTVKSILAEFIEPGTPDDGMLAKVVASLKFVKIIRPGDSIPTEVLNGTASWSVRDDHLELAKSRITLQIISWIKGQEVVVADHEALITLGNNPAVKQRVNAAFSDIALRLGLRADQRQEVIDNIERVARELSYIEALRERSAVLSEVFEKVAQFLKLYRGERVLGEEIMRMLNLMRRPIQDVAAILEQVDANCGEILGLLRNLKSQIDFIRSSRDDLHIRIKLWDEVVERWREIPVMRSPENEVALKELYRFIARHFIVEKQWQLTGIGRPAAKS